MKRAMLGVLCLVWVVASGCSTLDRAYKEDVTWTNAPVVHVFTNTVVVTNVVPVVMERTNVVFVTNVVQVPATNLVAKPGALAAIEATGSVVNTFAPGVGSILALALAGLYH